MQYFFLFFESYNTQVKCDFKSYTTLTTIVFCGICAMAMTYKDHVI